MTRAIRVCIALGVGLAVAAGSAGAAQVQVPGGPPAAPAPPPAAPAAGPVRPAQAQGPGGAPIGKGAAVILSILMPGTGEWLNRDFEGPFPLRECVAGYLCCFGMLSSALDAAAGDRSDSIRFNFWTKPVAEEYDERVPPPPRRK